MVSVHGPRIAVLVGSVIVAELRRCIGMIVGVYGIGYLMAARDTYLHETGVFLKYDIGNDEFISLS